MFYQFVDRKTGNPITVNLTKIVWATPGPKIDFSNLHHCDILMEGEEAYFTVVESYDFVISILRNPSRWPELESGNPE